MSPTNTIPTYIQGHFQCSNYAMNVTYLHAPAVTWPVLAVVTLPLWPLHGWLQVMMGATSLPC